MFYPAGNHVTLAMKEAQTSYIPQSQIMKFKYGGNGEIFLIPPFFFFYRILKAIKRLSSHAFLAG